MENSTFYRGIREHMHEELGCSIIGQRLEEDYQFTPDFLGIKDKSLPKLVSGDGQHYVHFYDDEMKDIVARKYVEEIALFEFEFGE